MLKRWEPWEEELVIRCPPDGAATAALARRLCRTPNAIRCRRHALNTAPDRYSRWSAEEDAAILEWWNEGRALAKRLGKPLHHLTARAGRFP